MIYKDPVHSLLMKNNQQSRYEEIRLNRDFDLNLRRIVLANSCHFANFVYIIEFSIKLITSQCLTMPKLRTNYLSFHIENVSIGEAKKDIRHVPFSAYLCNVYRISSCKFAKSMQFFFV